MELFERHLGSMSGFWSALMGIGHWSRESCFYWQAFFLYLWLYLFHAVIFFARNNIYICRVNLWGHPRVSKAHLYQCYNPCVIGSIPSQTYWSFLALRGGWASSHSHRFVMEWMTHVLNVGEDELQRPHMVTSR